MYITQRRPFCSVSQSSGNKILLLCTLSRVLGKFNNDSCQTTDLASTNTFLANRQDCYITEAFMIMATHRDLMIAFRIYSIPFISS